MFGFIVSSVKIVSVFLGCLLVAYNIELIPLKVSGLFWLAGFHIKLKKPTITELIVIAHVLLGIVISFWLTKIVYGYFGLGGRAFVLAVYMFFDMMNSLYNMFEGVLAPATDTTIVFDGDKYAIFFARVFGFMIAFVLMGFNIL